MELVVVGDRAKTLELDCLRLHPITSGCDGNAPLPSPQMQLHGFSQGPWQGR